jgi:hypothetical protein
MIERAQAFHTVEGPRHRALRRLSLGKGAPVTSADRPPLPMLDFARIGPKEGERFPDVVLPDAHGRRIDLHAARAGRRALVFFQRSASW